MRPGDPAAAAALTLRPVDPQHPAALALLADAAREVRALYPALFTGDEPPPGNAPAVPGSLYLLAEVGGRAVGSGAFRPLDDAGHAAAAGPVPGPLPTAELRRMFVAADWRGRGVARALLAALEQQARELGYRRLRLETGERQTPAMTLYAACGYQSIAPFGPHADDPTSRCYEKLL